MTLLKPPTGENLLDPETREKLTPLYNGEEQQLVAQADYIYFMVTGMALPLHEISLKLGI